MHQIVALIVDQRTRLAEKNIIMHERTVDILRPTRCENRLSSQPQEPRTEEHDRRIDRPKARHPGLGTPLQGLVHLEPLLHVRLRADKDGLLITSRSVRGGQMQYVGHEGVEERFEDVGFVHGGVAVGAGQAALDVKEGLDHAGLRERDGVFDDGLVIAAAFDCVRSDADDGQKEERGGQKTGGQ